MDINLLFSHVVMQAIRLFSGILTYKISTFIQSAFKLKIMRFIYDRILEVRKILEHWDLSYSPR